MQYVHLPARLLSSESTCHIIFLFNARVFQVNLELREMKDNLEEGGIQVNKALLVLPDPKVLLVNLVQLVLPEILVVLGMMELMGSKVHPDHLVFLEALDNLVNAVEMVPRVRRGSRAGMESWEIKVLQEPMDRL